MDAKQTGFYNTITINYYHCEIISNGVMCIMRLLYVILIA